MPVRVTCPSCATQLNIRDEHAGRAVKCPKCGSVIPPSTAATPEVPPPLPVPPPTPSEAPTRPTAKPAGTKPPRDRERDENEDDDRDRPKKRSRNRDDDEDQPRRTTKGGMPVWGWVVLGVGGFIALGVIVMCAGIMWVGKKANEGLQEVQKDIEQERRVQHEEREQDVKYVNLKKTDLTMAQFKVQRPKTPTTIRVSVKLADYWNYDYRESKESHFSFSLDGTNSYSEYGWIPKQSADGKRMYELTKDAKRHWMTLVVQWVGPEGRPTPPGQQGIAIQKLTEE